MTKIEGMAGDLDLKKIMRYWKKELHCNGNIQFDEERGFVIILQGDWREEVRQFLVEECINTKEEIRIHGH
jgi:translation initiation factor 1